MEQEKVNKLQTALIETGKEVERIPVPTLEVMQNEFADFKEAVIEGRTRDIRYRGRRVAAMITKYLIEKL